MIFLLNTQKFGMMLMLLVAVNASTRALAADPVAENLRLPFEEISEQTLTRLFGNPTYVRQGLVPAYLEILHQERSKHMTRVLDGDKIDPALSSLLKAGQSTWLHLLEESLRRLYDNKKFEQQGIDVFFLHTMVNRLDSALRRQATKVPLVQAQAMASSRMGLGSLSDLSGVFADNFQLQRIYEDNVYRFQDSEGDERQRLHFDFKKWRQRELAAIDQQIRSIHKALPRHLILAAAAEFFLVPKISVRGQPPTKFRILLDEKTVNAFQFTDLPIYSKDLVHVTTTNGQVYELWRDSPVAGEESKAVSAFDFWYHGNVADIVASVIRHPDKLHEFLDISVLGNYLKGLERWRDQLKTYRGPREFKALRKFSNLQMLEILRQSSFISRPPGKFEANLSMFYWAGFLFHGDDPDYLGKKEEFARHWGVASVFSREWLDRLLFRNKPTERIVGSAGSTHGAAVNSDEDRGHDLFEVRVRRFQSLPFGAHFGYQSARDFGETGLRWALLAPSAGKPHHEVVSLGKLLLEANRLVIPRRQGFAPQTVEITSGDMVYRLGVDFDLLEDVNAQFLFANFRHMPPAMVTVRAVFAKSAVAEPQSVPQDLRRLRAPVLAELGAELRRGGVVHLAESLLLLSLRSSGEVLAEDLADVFRRGSRYSYYPERAGSVSGAEGIFANHSRFVDDEGILCFQCDGSNQLFVNFLNEYFRRTNLPYVARLKRVLVREKGKLNEIGHVVTAVDDLQGRELWSADVTPGHMDSRNGAARAARDLLKVQKTQKTREIFEQEIQEHRKRMLDVFARADVVRGPVREGDYSRQTLRLLSDFAQDGDVFKAREAAVHLMDKIDKLRVYLGQRGSYSQRELDKYRPPAALETMSITLKFLLHFDESEYRAGVLHTGRHLAEGPNCPQVLAVAVGVTR